MCSNPYRQVFSADELQSIVEAAHSHDKPVLAHCRCTAAVNQALDAGVDTILHCFFYDADGTYRFDEATADRLAKSETWLNPTMHISRASQTALRQIKKDRGLDAEQQERLDRSI